MEGVDEKADAIKEKVLELLRSKKGQIADTAEVMSAIGDGASIILKEMEEAGSISIMDDSVFLNSDSYLPKVRCLICDDVVKRDDLVPFYREKHFPFVKWGFHKDCLSGGALEQMLSSGMFTYQDGKIFPAYEYGEGRGKNPVTIAIKYLRSDDFMYSLELSSVKRK